MPRVDPVLAAHDLTVALEQLEVVKASIENDWTCEDACAGRPHPIGCPRCAAHERVRQVEGLVRRSIPAVAHA